MANGEDLGWGLGGVRWVEGVVYREAVSEACREGLFAKDVEVERG